MRAVVRTSLVALATAGALLAPVAGTALAAGAPAAPQAAPVDDSRYLGEPVPLDGGMVAVLRNNDTTGPEAWIRATGPNWTPGQTYMVRVLGKLDARHTSARIHGVKLTLLHPGSARPVLAAVSDKGAEEFKLPVRNSDAGRGCVSQVRRVPMGAGMLADLTTSPKGPKAVLRTAGEDKPYATLTRRQPSLPSSAGITARILKADAPKPVFEWKTQGGGTPMGHKAFPALPKGC